MAYIPQSYTVTHTEQVSSLPVGPAPQPLPTSSNYVRPAKAHKGIGASLKGAWNKATSKAQRSTFDPSYIYIY